MLTRCKNCNEHCGTFHTNVKTLSHDDSNSQFFFQTVVTREFTYLPPLNATDTTHHTCTMHSWHVQQCVAHRSDKRRLDCDNKYTRTDSVRTGVRPPVLPTAG